MNFEISWEYQEIYFLGKFHGWAKLSDVEAWLNREISDEELLARCIAELPINMIHTKSRFNPTNN